MKIHRIYAVILRHLYNFKHSYDRMSDAFYWPAMDLVIWGLTSSYFVSLAPDTSKLIPALLGGILFWIVCWRAHYEVTINLLGELWDRNLINLFVSPLKFSEWVTALLCIGVIKAFISLAFAGILALVLYKFEFLSFGFYMLPFFLLLLMTGWWLGFLISAIILKYGTRVQTLGWTVIGAASPFSAIFFPVSILPEWAQVVSSLFPTSYVFEGMREVVYTGTLSWDKVYISFGLNILYFVLSLLLLKNSFKATLRRGLQSVG